MAIFRRVNLSILLVTCLSAVAPAKTTMMTPAEYGQFLKDLGKNIPMWQSSIQQLDLSSASAVERESVTRNNVLAVALLSQVKDRVPLEQEHAQLGREIYMHRDLWLATDLLSQSLSEARGVRTSKSMENTLSGLLDAIRPFYERLFLHVVGKADDMEFRIEDCASEATKPR